MKTILFNPFRKYSESQLLLVGTLLSLVGALLCTLFNIRFIGVFKMNATDTFSAFGPLADIVICVSCLTLFLGAAAKLINNKTRLIDILATAVLAFAPLGFLSVFNSNNRVFDATEKIERLTIDATAKLDLTYLMVFAFVSILVLVWCVMLLFNGFKIASNAKSSLHNIYFVMALVLADVASRMIIELLNF